MKLNFKTASIIIILLEGFISCSKPDDGFFGDQTNRKHSIGRQFLTNRTVTAANNLYVEYLPVIDLSTYNFFVSLYGPNSSNTVITDNINTYFTQLVNGMNQRYQGSLANDNDLMLTIVLKNVLILKDPSITQWTNATLCRVKGYSTYASRIPILNNCSLAVFQNYMNSIASTLPFSFDHAVAIIPQVLDVWDSSASSSPNIRSGVIGTSPIGGICSSAQYSIIEYAGLNSIQNAAHELGHNLGAVHDQTGLSGSCIASNNHIMNSNVGSYTNASNLFFFSNCSLYLFKNTLLTPDYRNVAKKCLLNSPVSTFAITSATYQYPGQFYTLPQQCKLAIGSYSTSVGCNSGSLAVCSTLGCIAQANNGLICTSTNGYGALDGTSCKVSNPVNGITYMCYQGNCVNSASIFKTVVVSDPCNPNPCQNRGICIKNSTTSSVFCHCSPGSSYKDLLCSIPV